ncbi:MAG: hypothetical protein AAF371_01795 [Pseudomonadota bacterium]
MTLGALLVYFFREKLQRYNFNDLLCALSVILSILILISLIMFISSIITINLSSPAFFLLVWAKLIPILALPYVAAGVIIALALTGTRLPIGKVYAFDLVGAAAGCFFILALTAVMDGVSAVMFLAALSALAGILFRYGLADDAVPASETRVALPLRLGIVAPGVLLFSLALSLANATVFPNGLRIFMQKDVLYGADRIADIRWNSFSRVDISFPIFTSAPLQAGPPGLSREELPGLLIRDMRMDGDASTSLYAFEAGKTDLSFMELDLTNIGYFAGNSGRAAVIGVGGGRDVLAAHHFGFEEITGVEINPIFIDLLENEFRDFSQVAEIEGVALVVDEARAWFASTDERFDFIQMSLIDTWAATGVGAFSLTENGLYTIEGWSHFLESLSPGGIFTVSRWFSPENLGETGRTVSLAKATLLALGAEEPDRHIALFRSERLSTIIVGRDPLSEEQLDGMMRAAERIGFEVLYAPEFPPSDPIMSLVREAKTIQDLHDFVADAPLNFAPPTDSEPFFFNQLKLSSLVDAREILAKRGIASGNLVATIFLATIILLSVVAVVLTAILPSISAVRRIGPKLAFGGTAFFLSIGLGFMFIEIALMQRLSIFLGHPVYGLAVALAGIILSTGLGSALSERFPLDRPARLAGWSALTGAWLLLMPLWLPALTGLLDTAGIAVRCLVALIVILPAGLLLGFGFPTGMRLVSRIDTRPTPWFWAVNGAAGVLASGLAVAVGTYLSINTSFAIGAVCYLLLAPVGLMLLRAHVGDGSAPAAQDAQGAVSA